MAYTAAAAFGQYLHRLRVLAFVIRVVAYRRAGNDDEYVPVVKKRKPGRPPKPRPLLLQIGPPSPSHQTLGTPTKGRGRRGPKKVVTEGDVYCHQCRTKSAWATMRCCNVMDDGSRCLMFYCYRCLARA